MKKILSLILCGLFLNLVFSPVVFAEEMLQPSSEEQTVTNNDAVTDSTPQISDQIQNTAETVSQTQDSNVVEVQNQSTSTIEQQNLNKTEHLSVRKNKSKRIDVESVYISTHDVVIPAQDILQIAFANDFNGKKAQVGDTIEFRFPNDIVTEEGTMIIPSTAKIIAEITKLKNPKPLHLSGKVYLDFKYIEVNGTRKPIQAKLYGKKEFLSRRTLNNTAAVGETAVASGAGAIAGAAICASTATDAAVVIFGTAISAGVGAVAGVAVGILLPGASFKAKAGQRVNIELTNELDIQE